MSRRGAVRLGLAGAVVVLLAVGLALFQPWLLFIDEQVDEDLPGGATSVETASGGLEDPGDPAGGGGGQGGEDRDLVQLAAGDFVDAEHDTSGQALVLREADGTRYVRLEDLDTSNGPDLHVWLTDQTAGGSWFKYDDGAYVALGRLKANQGSQNYEIPAHAELGGMRSVVIWCDRFNVAFGAAPIG